jgi:chemotaxis signal transduction protein
VSEREFPGTAAEELRRRFDAAFGERPADGHEEVVALLALRVGGEPVAMRVLETSGLVPARRVVPVPSRRTELLGISGLRGAVVPVYGLARLLGRGEEVEPRWIVLVAAGGEERVGLAVAAFERHLVVPARDLRPAEHAAPRAHVREILHVAGASRPVLSVPSLVKAITGG